MKLELLVTLAECGRGGYLVVEERMNMTHGSIGPTRRRALHRLRRALARAGYDLAGQTPGDHDHPTQFR